MLQGIERFSRRFDLIIYQKSKYFSAEQAQDNLTGLSPLLVRALRARGAVTPEQIERFLHPSAEDFHDPFLLPDMDKAVQRIHAALENGERICIFGDYDVDGICSTAMLVDYFHSVGADVGYHIPSRREEGYGMSRGAIDKLHSCGVNLIITVDNGISAADEISYCSELGIDVIVTDHHIPPETVPKCTAVVCHTVSNSQYPNSILCGAGIAFKLLHALAGLEAAMQYVSLAGLASVADVVPLLDENRVFVKLGLDAINSGNCCNGLYRLLNGVPTARRPYNACTLGFAVAPRLNASGRMSDASLGVELFLCRDPNRADEIIARLNKLNELRQQDEANILNDAIRRLEPCDLSDTRAIVLRSETWNAGVIGIAASRIAEMYHRPTILFSESDGILKGSARSIDGVNIHEVLCCCRDFFVRFGGHAKAAGITMESAFFEDFRLKLNACLKAGYDDSVFIPCKRYEFDIPLEQVTRELISELTRLAPFGESNPSPVFRSRHVAVSRLRRFGSDAQHTKMDVSPSISSSAAPLDAVWFASAASYYRLLNADTVDILYTPGINNWNGFDSIQLRVVSAKAEQPRDIDAYIEKGMRYFCNGLLENLSYRLSEPEQLPEICETTLAELCSRSISGLLVLVFSVESAKKILDEIRSSQIGNVDICYSCVADSPVCCNTVLLAPQLANLPAFGFSKVVFYDNPPCSGVYTAVSRRMSSASMLRMPCTNSDFGRVALQFACDRDFMVCSYKLVQSILAASPCSQGELCGKMSNKLNVPVYCALFAVRVFIELGFIEFTPGGALRNSSEIRPAPLCASTLYSAVERLRTRNFPDSEQDDSDE